VRILSLVRVTLAGTALLGLVDSARAAAQGVEPPAAEAEYTIGPADVLQIIVWKEPDLTRDVTVRFDGVVTVHCWATCARQDRRPRSSARRWLTV